MLLHQGGSRSAGSLNDYADVNGCENLDRRHRAIAARASPDVDVVVTAHTHQAYNCLIDGTLVTSASSFGRLVTDVDLTIDRRPRTSSEDAATNLRRHARRRPTDPARDRDRRASTARSSAPIANRVVGIDRRADVTRAPATPAGESALGDVIADAQLAATAPSDFGGARGRVHEPGRHPRRPIYAQCGGERPAR